MTEEDIIDLPALFKLDKQGKAMPYFPNMVRGVPAPRVLQSVPVCFELWRGKIARPTTMILPSLRMSKKA